MLTNEKVNDTESLWNHGLQLDWLGQMVASVFWAASVFVYGITSTGDVLQLCAALAWMVANIATLMSYKTNNKEGSNNNT